MANNRVSAWLQNMKNMLLPKIKTKEQLANQLRAAKELAVLDQDALQMLEGVLAVSDMQVRDIMVPRPQMAVIEKNEPLNEFLPKIVESGHSRFPIIGDDKDDVLGILLAKDLLGHLFHHKDEDFNLREFMRPVIFVPESKRLNVLLKDFRSNRNHLAIVSDEYGGVSGLVTIEDVLEEIVGDIADEHDTEGKQNFIRRQDADHYAVAGLTPIELFNDYFDAKFSDEEFDTIAGLVVNAFGHLPKKGEITQLDDFQFEVVDADDRQIHRLRVLRKS
jgi:magnesium and cobalt transporter